MKKVIRTNKGTAESDQTVILGRFLQTPPSIFHRPTRIDEKPEIYYTVDAINQYRQHRKERKPIMKIFIGIWYAVVHPFFFVYLYRVMRFLVLRYHMKTAEKAC